MPKLFNRANTTTAKKTFAIYRQEISKDMKSFLAYAILIPLNRLLYIVILPLFFSLIIQSLIVSPHDITTPLQLLGGAVIVSGAAIVSSTIGFRRLFYHEETMVMRLTERSIDRLMRHSDQFFANRKVGTLAGDINSFSNSIVSFLDIVFLSASGIIVNFTASLIIIAILSPSLLLPLILVTALLVWRSLVGTAKRGPIRHQRKILTARLNGTVADILGNHQIVRYFASNRRETKRVVADRRAIYDVTVEEIKVIEREAIARLSTLFSFQIITIGISIWLFTNDAVSIAALIFTVTYLGRLTGSLYELAPLIRNIEQAFLDAANMTEILQENPDVNDAPNAKRLAVARGAITFSDVTFTYDQSTGPAVIQNLSTVIKPGERVGLVGHSGGGKTTLTKLLLRFADITGGSIAIDGQNIQKVTQESLRKNIAYVPQETYLFHRSLRENIAYAKPSATDNEIMLAVARANVSDFINELPDGLDTIVGERGVKLSGGQRQRIAIARAILKDAPILVLDEATSALDSESEKLIQNALEKLMKGRTAIVIAHRLSTIAKLDRILVLEKGSIIEDGSHQELLQLNGTYARLWQHQSGGMIEE